MPTPLSASSIVPHVLSEVAWVSTLPARVTYPGSTTFPGSTLFPGLSDGTGALSESAIVPVAGLFPGSTTFPSSTTYPGRGSFLSAKAA